MNTLTKLLSFLYVATLVAYAEPRPIPGSVRVAPVFKRSDVVCICMTQTVNEQSEEAVERGGRTVTVRQMRANVSVMRAYKGAYGEGEYLTVVFDSETPRTTSSPSLQTGKVAILFLVSAGDSTFRVDDKYVGDTAISALPIVGATGGLDGLEDALGVLLSQSGGVDQRKALILLEGFDEYHPDTISRISAATNASDPDVALEALAVFIKANPTTGLKRLAEYMSKYQGNDQHMGFLSLGTEISRINDPTAETSLEQLASSRFLTVRVAAMHSIRHLKAPTSGATLVKQLDDTDRTIQYLAVISLAELYGKGGDYGPGFGEFQKTPESYVSRWKTWWKQGGSMILPPPQ